MSPDPSHRSLSRLCWKRLVTSRRTVRFLLDALCNQPANRHDESHDLREDDNRHRAGPLVFSSPHHMRSPVRLPTSAPCWNHFAARRSGFLDTPARSTAAVSDQTALSPLAKDRTKNTPQTATKTAPGRRASGSSTAKATKYRSQDPA